MPFYRLFLSCFLMLLSAGLWAQNSGLYVVDVITFLHNPMNAEQEHWPKTIDISPQQPAALLVNNRLQDMFPDVNDPKQDYSNHTLPLLPKHFSQLQETGQTISRLQRYRSIEHITFAQRIGTKDKAPHIVLQNQFTEGGKKYRLGGSIQLSVNRYLHVHSNLWLAEMANSNQAPQPVKATLPEKTLSEPAKQTLQALDTSKMADMARWPTLPTTVSRGFASEAKHHLQRLTKTTNDATAGQPTVNFISTLVQHRKMRSSERHYIDHPLFGIIIQITPLEKVLEQQEQQK